MGKNKRSLGGIISSHVVDAFTRTKSDINNAAFEQNGAKFEFSINKMFDDIVEAVKDTATTVQDATVDIKSTLKEAMSQVIAGLRNEKHENEMPGLDDYMDEDFDMDGYVDDYMEENADEISNESAYLTVARTNNRTSGCSDCKFNFFRFLVSSLNNDYLDFKNFVMNGSSHDAHIYKNIYSIDIQDDSTEELELDTPVFNVSDIFNTIGGIMSVTNSVSKTTNFENIRAVNRNIEAYLENLNTITSNRTISDEFYKFLEQYINLFNIDHPEDKVDFDAILYNIELLNHELIRELNDSMFKRIHMLYIAITEDITDITERERYNLTKEEIIHNLFQQ